MRRSSFPLLFLLLLILAALAAGCGRHPAAEPTQNQEEKPEYLVDFSEGPSGEFHWADGWSNGGVFNCSWRKENAVIEDGTMALTVSREGNEYYGAEYRSNESYSYGMYSVSMKAAKGSGMISSFFIYTGDPWDEIDIEFLGKDTTKVQFNYYTDGVGGHEYVYDLGFDAAEEFHDYAFLWEPDRITWFVDGVEVYRAEADIPSHPGQIMMNVWNARNADDWTGKLDETALPASAEYRWINYSE
jgi:endoglucanase